MMKMKSALVMISCWFLLSWRSPTFAEDDAEQEVPEKVTPDNAEQLVTELSTTEELVDLICSCREEDKLDMAEPSLNPLASHPHPLDCYDKQQMGQTKIGQYDIFPLNKGVQDTAVRVWCDMDADGGGWTVFQRREDGTVDFYLDWATYKTGFGYVGGEHWLGNDKLQVITNQRRNFELRVELEDWNGNARYAKYDHFRIGDESMKYRLAVGTYSWNAGDSLTYHNNQPFSTGDVDNDARSDNCAEDTGGPWWYNSIQILNDHEGSCGIYWSPR